MSHSARDVSIVIPANMPTQITGANDKRTALLITLQTAASRVNISPNPSVSATEGFVLDTNAAGGDLSDHKDFYTEGYLGLIRGRLFAFSTGIVSLGIIESTCDCGEGRTK